MANGDRSEKIDLAMSELCVIMDDPQLGQLGVTIEPLRNRTLAQLTLLRTSIRGLKDLRDRDQFLDDPSLRGERHKYNKDIAAVETYFDIELLSAAKSLHQTLVDKPEGKTLAEQLEQILNRGRDIRPNASTLQPPQFAVTEGQNRAAERMSASDVRAAVTKIMVDIQVAKDQIDIVYDYKCLHDLLHNLELRCYNPIVQETKRFPEDETARENLTEHQQEVQLIVDELKVVARRSSLGTNDISWIDDLNQAQSEMCPAIDHTDKQQLMKSVRRMNRVLAIQPSQINTRLNDAARVSRLPALITSMTVVRANLSVLNLDSERVKQFEGDVDALADLNNTLATLIRDHDNWQAVDRELRRIEANLEPDLSELEFAWPDLKAKTLPLYGDSSEDWVKSLKLDAEKLERAIAAQDPTKIKQHFRSFQTRARNLFYRVDTNLKLMCEDFRRKDTEHLTSILRMTL